MSYWYFRLYPFHSLRLIYNFLPDVMVVASLIRWKSSKIRMKFPWQDCVEMISQTIWRQMGTLQKSASEQMNLLMGKVMIFLFLRHHSAYQGLNALKIDNQRFKWRPSQPGRNRIVFIYSEKAMCAISDIHVHWPLYQYEYTLIPAWIRNHMQSKIWGKTFNSQTSSFSPLKFANR